MLDASEQAEVARFIPRTLSDSLASTPPTEDNPDGSCAILSNLVPDRSTPGFYAPRSALTPITNLPSTTAGVSVGLVLGSRIYYMASNPKTSSYSANAVKFNGSTNYLSTAANLSGITDTKTGSLSMWVRIDSDTGSIEDLVVSGTAGQIYFNVYWQGNNFHVGAVNSSLTTIVNFATASGLYVPNTTKWLNILASWNLATGAINLYVNNVSDKTVFINTNDTINYSHAGNFWDIGSFNGAQLVNGALSEVWFDTSYIDFSVAANRAKFIDNNGFPVSLGASGQTPTGSSPLIYLKNPAATVGTNSGTGGNFTANGAFVAANNSPSTSVNGDVPFCFDTSISAFVPIANNNNPQFPSTQVTSGDWVPPVMALVGTKIMICHPGYNGGVFIGWIDLTSPNAPTYNTGDLSGAITFAGTAKGLPSCVSNFNGRAYYGVSNLLILSDSLNPTMVTNASQELTVGDNQAITAIIGQPFTSATQGGIIQALAVFKALSIAQVTGDPSTTNLLLNVITNGLGTNAPRTVAVSPKGLMFMAADGIRILGLDGEVTEAIPAVKLPFDNAQNPTRACAAFNDGAYRITVNSPDANGNYAFREYVFDLKFGWTGPHTSAASWISPISDSSVFHFVTYNINQAGGLFGPYYSNIVPHPTDTFTEYGTPLTWEMQTAIIPSSELLDVRRIVWSTLQYVAPGSSDTINVSAMSPEGGTLASATVSGAVAGFLWNGTTWGGGMWNYGQQGFRAYSLKWNAPVVFKEAQFDIKGTSALKQRIGWLQYQLDHVPEPNNDLP